MSRNRRVTHAQLESLWDILNSNRALATGYNKSAQAREHSKQMWMRVESILNSHGECAVKDWKGWCKYWNDYKSKLKSRVAAARATHRQTGGGPAESKPLNDLEKKFLQILGEDFGSGLPGARVEPFEELPFQQMQVVEDSTVLDIPGTDETYNDGVNVSESILLQGQTCQLVLPSPGSPQPGPSTAPPQPAPQPAQQSQQAPPIQTLSPPPISPSPIAPGALRTPQRSPRRRRRVTRREPSMTQEMARRILVQLSEKNTRMAERRLQLFENLVRDIGEIKEILKNSR